MGKALLVGMCVVLLGGGCSKKRIRECDEFLATYEKVAACPSFPESTRAMLDKVAKTLREQLDKIDPDEASRTLLDMLVSNCTRHKQTVIDAASKLGCNVQ